MQIKRTVLIILFLTLFSSIFHLFFSHRTISFKNNSSSGSLISQNESSNLHYSFFSQREFYDKAFDAYVRIDKNQFDAYAIIDKNQFENLGNSGTKTDKNIRGVVVNHHLLAPDLIAETFNIISSEKPITVALISPNHFFAGRGQIISSLYDWKTPYGVLESDKNLIRKLEDANLLNVEESPFEKEHGISNLVAFIKKTLPSAKIVPLIVKDTFSFRAGDVFAENLNKILPQDSLIIASLDFSHFLPSNAADFHDAKSLAVITNFDYEAIKFLDVDSKPSLRIFLKYLDLKDAKEFTLLKNSNSAKILEDEKISETTSYITGFFSLGDKKENNQITLLSFGDLMLDRYVKKEVDENGKNYPFLNIERFLGGSDLVLANLEGSFTDFQAKPLDPNNTIFTFNPDLVPALKRLGFNIFNLANNHSLDFGKTGFGQSKNYLKNSVLDYFGDPQNNTDISIIKNIRGTKIGFVGFNEFNSNFSRVIDEIKKIKQETDFVVVYAHWGKEYQENFSKNQQTKAHQFIDAGADVVLGSHPHIIQPIEVYKNKVIFYSLGNFLFDQTFSLKTQQGLGVGIVFGKPNMDYYIFPIEIKNFQIELMDKEKNDIILDKLANDSLASQSIKNQIFQGEIKMKLLNNSTISP